MPKGKKAGHFDLSKGVQIYSFLRGLKKLFSNWDYTS